MPCFFHPIKILTTLCRFFIVPHIYTSYCPCTTYSMDSFATTRAQLLEEKGEDSPPSMHADVATVVT